MSKPRQRRTSETILWTHYDIARLKSTAGAQYEALVNLHNHYTQQRQEPPIYLKWLLLAHERTAGVGPRKLVDREREYGGTRYPY